MLSFLKDSEALERSMNKSLDREDDGFDHIRSGMNAISTGAGLVKQGAQVYMDIQDAVDSVDRATSHGARTSSEAGLDIDREGRTKVQKISQSTPLGAKSINSPQTGIGSAHTQVVGNNTAPPIRLTLGKQLGPLNSIENFLSLMNATGSVSVSFGGKLISAADSRVRTYNIYRHNLHGDANLTENGAYPPGSFIMNPTGSLNVELTGGHTVSAVLNRTQIRDIKNGSVFWSFYNKPDLEDVSWNLNKLKLGPQSQVAGTDDFNTPVNGASPKIQLLDDVKLLQGSAHRAFSAMYQNNERHDYGSTPGSARSSPYIYDSVFKQGTVDYLFMNKGQSPCEVEIIVYRTKKNGIQGVAGKFGDFDIQTQLEGPITQGMMKKVLSGIGTDYTATGYTPASSDWVGNPDYPFLPKNRFIDQSSTPFTEVNRVKLCMQSGQRRPFQLKLGGIKYNPCTSVLRKVTGSLEDKPTSCPLLDEHSYVVCIALNGIAMSRQLGGQTNATGTGVELTSGPIIGDTHAPADLQWYGTYTEDVGAMAYKKIRSRNVWTSGQAQSIAKSVLTYNQGAGTTQRMTSTPVALLTQAQAVRLSTAPTQLTFGSGGVAGSETATSSTQTQSAVGGDTVTPV